MNETPDAAASSPAPAAVAPTPAGALRRLAAAAYDGLLLLAVLMLATAALLPLTGGEAITFGTAGPLEYLYRAFVAALVVGYYGAAWTRRGETLGMKAWHIRLLRADGALPRWGDVLRRLAIAAPLYLLPISVVLLAMAGRATGVATALAFVPLALSHALLLRRPVTLHDAWSRTRVVRVDARVRAR